MDRRTLPHPRERAHSTPILETLDGRVLLAELAAERSTCAVTDRLPRDGYRERKDPGRLHATARWEPTSYRKSLTTLAEIKVREWESPPSVEESRFINMSDWKQAT